LNETNIKILYAKNGKKAVEYFSVNKDIDLIIMDVRLPEMSGIEATKLMREIKPDIPVIAQTAFAMEEDRARAKAAGFDEYLVKPLNRKDFLRIVSKYLG
jgi:CheY-like chemotaxis protein